MFFTKTGNICLVWLNEFSLKFSFQKKMHCIGQCFLFARFFLESLHVVMKVLTKFCNNENGASMAAFNEVSQNISGIFIPTLKCFVIRHTFTETFLTNLVITFKWRFHKTLTNIITRIFLTWVLKFSDNKSVVTVLCK